jgi:hypothetical protein
MPKRLAAMRAGIDCPPTLRSAWVIRAAMPYVYRIHNHATFLPLWARKRLSPITRPLRNSPTLSLSAYAFPGDAAAWADRAGGLDGQSAPALYAPACP